MRICKICHKDQDLKENLQDLTKTFINRGYDENMVNEQVTKAAAIPREQLLHPRTKEPSNRIPLIMKYNRTLPPIRTIINNHWEILKIDKNIKETFTETPVIAFRRNKNLKDLIEGNTIENNRKKIRTRETKPTGRCQPCQGRADALCCKQV